MKRKKSDGIKDNLSSKIRIKDDTCITYIGVKEVTRVCSCYWQ